MSVEEDTLSSALNFRLSELAEDSERSDARNSGPRGTLPRHFLAFLPLSVFATLTVVAGPVVAVAALVPRHRSASNHLNHRNLPFPSTQPNPPLRSPRRPL